MSVDPLEISLERWFLAQCKKRGYICIKLGFIVGLPDRVVFAPEARLAFVEFKKKNGGRFAKAQIIWAARFANLGFKCYKCADRQQAKFILDSLETGATTTW